MKLTMANGKYVAKIGDGGKEMCKDKSYLNYLKYAIEKY